MKRLIYIPLIACIVSSIMAQDTRLIGEHINIAINEISDTSKIDDSVTYADKFDFINMLPLSNGEGKAFKVIYRNGEVAQVAWQEFQSQIEVNLYRIEDYYYGYISIDGNKISKGILVRSMIDELYYIKLSDGFIGWLDQEERLPHDSIVSEIESIYSLDSELNPSNIADFDDGRITKLNLNGTYYDFEEKCTEVVPNLRKVGFDIIGAFINDIECGWVSSTGSIEKYKDWIAYFQFDTM